MARYTLDFGSTHSGLALTFDWFVDAATFAALPPPAIYQTPGAWTYYFDYVFPAASSESTQQISYGLHYGSFSGSGVSLTGQLVQPGYQPTRVFLDWNWHHGSQTPPGFSWYQDDITKAALSQPAIFNNPASGAWDYYFDVAWPVATTAIEYGVNPPSGATGGLTGVLAAPVATDGAGGSMTLLQLRDKVREESDTENDPNISDATLTGWINQSMYRLYDKLITCFGEDYFSAQAQFTTDGVSNSFALPNGTLYGGAAAFYKGELLETIGGGAGASPQSPITLRKFNMREKNRYAQPLNILAVPNALPRYRMVGSNIVFTPLPAAGLVCNLWYAPKLAPLVNDYDVANDFSGWLELVIVDCVIKAMGKQERDPSLFLLRKTELLAEIDAAAPNRDLAEPNTVSMTEGDDFTGGGAFGGGGGWW